MFLNESKDSKANKKILFMIIPIVLLGMDMINMLDCFIKYQTNFLQLLIDLLGTVSLLFIFPKNKTKKRKEIVNWIIFRVR